MANYYIESTIISILVNYSLFPNKLDPLFPNKLENNNKTSTQHLNGARC